VQLYVQCHIQANRDRGRSSVGQTPAFQEDMVAFQMALYSLRSALPWVVNGSKVVHYIVNGVPFGTHLWICTVSGGSGGNNLRMHLGSQSIGLQL
jgi:hypothetical protein